MENIIKMVTEKAGISEAQAKKAVETVMTFLKDKMPGGVGVQVENFMKNGEGTAKDVIGGIRQKVSK